MGGVNCIHTFFGFLDFFYIYKVPKEDAAETAMHQSAAEGAGGNL